LVRVGMIGGTTSECQAIVIRFEPQNPKQNFRQGLM
jgi:hypothetical protein